MSQNDYHLDKDGNLRSGLGSDEPTPEQKSRASAASRRALEKMRAEITQAGEELSAKEADLEVREQTLAEKEAEIEALRQQLQEQLASVTSGSGRRSRGGE